MSSIAQQGKAIGQKTTYYFPVIERTISKFRCVDEYP
jgi:hypothetical protein